MKANFQITLPSIPGKNIKFKIQDIKTAAFLSQKSRFPQNKSFLTKKFVESFQNFHETKNDDQIDTQPQSEYSKTASAQRKTTPFRLIISDNKKHLLPVYTEIKNQEKERLENPVEFEEKTKGYSFGKAKRKNEDLNEKEQNDFEGQESQKSLTENYYFTMAQKQKKQQMKNIKPSAVFKNQTRERTHTRIYRSIVPGPGSYITQRTVTKKNKQKRINHSVDNTFVDYKHLKNVIAKVLVEEKEQDEEEEMMKKESRPDHMFAQDDRDRFGDQIFPIAPKLKVPGPGSYDTHGSIEEKTKKIALVQQQRKLLKDWFNN